MERGWFRGAFESAAVSTGMADNPEVIVIGAGLAAADELGRHGVHTRVLEVRARFGGRMLRHGGDWPVPAELGAEFIHGGNTALSQLMDEEGLQTEPVRGESWLFEHGALRAEPVFWGKLESGQRTAREVTAARGRGEWRHRL